ncbi:MAG: hypothetical protein ABMA26_08180 [Limisphaerales bacterium]
MRNDLMHPAWLQPARSPVSIEARVQRSEQPFRLKLQCDAREQREMGGPEPLDALMEHAAESFLVGREFGGF